VPEGYDVLWVRILNDKIASFRISPADPAGADPDDLNEVYVGGKRNSTEIAPDGGA